jgi:hypothetical protein
MTSQKLLSKITPDTFSEATIAEVKNIIGTSTVITPELAEHITECLEREIDADLQDVELDPEVASTLELELSVELAAAERNAKEAQEQVEKNLNSLLDMSKRVDVLERLHG